ncbi:MAG: SAM-dependent methyltransferase, partial [Halobacteriota archaeon]|nr:SAM-dependent methyltransferase [Halobacteriota archaeon]
MAAMRFQDYLGYVGRIIRRNGPSNTAEIIAFFRAVESFKPEEERVCYDPFAVDFISLLLALIARSRIQRDMVPRIFDRVIYGQYSYIVARTRYIDDYLERCIASGIEQLVILGAGYDSRAYRSRDIPGKIKVFEVDHPVTQKRKIKKVKERFGSIPSDIFYVGIDFSTEKLDKLLENGYDKALKTLFIWEGVTMYLSEEDVDRTLAFVSSNAGESSSIIFDYILKSALDGTNETKGAKEAVRYLSLIGEPYTFGIEEGNIEDFLCERGFH